MARQLKDPERERAKLIAYRKLNRERINTYERERRTNNPEVAESARASCKKYRLKNLDAQRERVRKYAKDHPDKNRAGVRRYRARKLKAEGSHTAQQLIDLMTRQGGKCADCERKFWTKLPPTLDHIIPLTKGGTEYIDNLRWTCKPCNGAKYNKSPDEWARKLGKLFL